MNPQFNREGLQSQLGAAGIGYLFLGKELGARSDDPSCREQGRVQYDRLAVTHLFKQGIDRVQEAMKRYRLVLMCAEKEPLECHRAVLVTRRLSAIGIPIHHILADGGIESQAALLERLRLQLDLPECDLFRSYDEILVDAYRIQGLRIAHSPTDAHPDGLPLGAAQ